MQRTIPPNDKKYEDYYNRRAGVKEMKIGEQVIVLLPDSTNKLLSIWQGPGLIVDFKPPHSYLLELDGGQRRWLHVNKLRRYHARVQSILVGNCAITYESDEDVGTLPTVNTTNAGVDLPSTRVDLSKLDHLSSDQQREFLDVLDDFADVFNDKPGECKVGIHSIHVTPEFKPKRLRVYRVPELPKPEIGRQIQELLDLGFIQPSNSEMASPIVCVLKEHRGENGVPLCCDYRYLNKFTRGDSFPTPDITDVIHKVGKAFWISSWDTRSGY